MVAGTEGGGRVRAEGGTGSSVGPVGEGGGGDGAGWRGWWRLGELKPRERGPGGSWWRLGERERRERVVEGRWRCGERERRGRVRRPGKERERHCLPDRPRRSSRASQEVSAGPGGPRALLPGTRGGGGPPPSLAPPRRGAAVAAAGGTGRLTVPGGAGPGGPLRHVWWPGG